MPLHQEDILTRLMAIESKQDRLAQEVNSLRGTLDATCMCGMIGDLLSERAAASVAREPSVLKSTEYFVTIGNEHWSLEMRRSLYERTITCPEADVGCF